MVLGKVVAHDNLFTVALLSTVKKWLPSERKYLYPTVADAQNIEYGVAPGAASLPLARGSEDLALVSPFLLFFFGRLSLRVHRAFPSIIFNRDL